MKILKNMNYFYTMIQTLQVILNGFFSEYQMLKKEKL